MKRLDRKLHGTAYPPLTIVENFVHFYSTIVEISSSRILVMNCCGPLSFQAGLHYDNSVVYDHY